MADGFEIASFFHDPTSTASHILLDRATGEAAVIDPVLDFDPANGRAATTFSDSMLAALGKMGGTLRWVLETHLHADHLSGGDYLRAKTGAKIVAGSETPKVQAIFKPKFAATDLRDNGADFDRLVGDGEIIALGRQEITVWHTPGHTRACVSYLIGDAAFVGDTVFMPDYGTARTDFPSGDAGALYRSIVRLHALPDATRFYLCHDYRGPGRSKTEMVTTALESRANLHLDGIGDEGAFVARRQAKDKTLTPPRLLAPSVQVNIRAGRMPPPDADGRVYLRIPVNGL